MSVLNPGDDLAFGWLLGRLAATDVAVDSLLAFDGPEGVVTGEFALADVHRFWEIDTASCLWKDRWWKLNLWFLRSLRCLGGLWSLGGLGRFNGGNFVNNCGGLNCGGFGRVHSKISFLCEKLKLKQKCVSNKTCVSKF